jgi:hypothetical protein
MIVIYENPVMKSRAVTRWLCLCKRNSKSNAGRVRNSYFRITTVGTGPEHETRIAAEGDVGLTGDYLAVQGECRS